MKRHPLLWATALLAGIFFTIGALGRWQLPKLNALAMVEFEKFTRKHLPVQLLVKSLEVSFVPLGAVLRDVNIRANKGAGEDGKLPILEQTEIDTLTVQISPWQLLRGRVFLQNVSIEGLHVVANIPAPQKKSGPPLAGIFDLLRDAPVVNISVTDGSLRLNLLEPQLTTEISDLDLNIEKLRGNFLNIELSSGTFQLLRAGAGSAANLTIEAATNMKVGRNSVEISSFSIQRGESHLEASGTLKGDLEALTFTDSNLLASSDLRLNSMGPWAAKMFPAQLKKMPALDGRAHLKAHLLQSGGDHPSVDFSATTEGLRISRFNIARLSLGGALRTVLPPGSTKKVREISIANIELEHPAGTASIENFTLTLDGDMPFSMKVKPSAIQLHEILTAIDLKRVPVFAQISAEFPCSGTLGSVESDAVLDPVMNCKGHVHAENILVRSSLEDKGTIIAFRELTADGDVTMNKERVSYTAELVAPHSKGRSSGVVTYDTGFKINYEADQLAMIDITNLVDLRLDGTAKIKGTTSGNTDYGIIDMNLEVADGWLEDYWLGNAKGPLSYRAGDLSFNGVQGFYTVSRYNGDVKINVRRKDVVLTGRIPFFDAKDLTKIFSRRVKLPFVVTGTGQAQVKVSGPLEFSHLSYDLKSSLYHGSVWNESFEQANFDVKSVGGEVKADRVQIMKGIKGGVINLTGEGHSTGLIKTFVQGRGLRLEDSAIMSALGLAISGTVDFDMDMSGPVLAPDTDFRGHLSKTLIGDQEAEDSTFKMKFFRNSLDVNGEFLGKAIQTSFIYPYGDDTPFALKLTTKDWNFAPAFAAIVGTISRKDYEGHLTASVDLKSPTGGFWNSSGTVRAENLSLLHGPVYLKSTAPISILMKNGQMQVDKFDLAGDNAFLKVSESAKPTSKVDLQFNGKLDLTLLGLLTPFFEDMRGIGSFAFNLKSNHNSTDLLGSAYIEKAYLKFFDFIHPFEDVRIDMLFNQKKVLLNTVKADFAGGRISSTGNLEFKGFKNTPLNLSGQFENVSLNLPEKVKTNGSGIFSLTGSWFPFTFKGTYDVKDGLITKDVAGDGSETSSVRRDQFLPQLLVKEQFVPLLLDLDINFTRGIVVKNELIDGKIMGQLSVKGTPTKPALIGQLTLEKDSKITVKDSQFDVTSASVQFTDPKEMNPQLYIVARTHVQEYDVNLLIQGKGNDPKLNFTSSPALSERDIISLLALGTTDQQQANPAIQANTANTAAAQQTANLNSSGPFKNNAISKEIKEKTGFDVQFAPGADESGLTQKIIIRKQFSGKLSVAASQSMGSRRESDAEVRYRLNNHLSSILSWENSDNLDTLDKTANTNNQEQNQFGLDLEYKFEFK